MFLYPLTSVTRRCWLSQRFLLKTPMSFRIQQFAACGISKDRGWFGFNLSWIDPPFPEPKLIASLLRVGRLGRVLVRPAGAVLGFRPIVPITNPVWVQARTSLPHNCGVCECPHPCAELLSCSFGSLKCEEA